MRAWCAGLVIAPLAAAAAMGQGTMTFSWTASDTGNGDGIVEPGESAVVTLWAFMDPEAVMFAAAYYDIAGDEAWQGRVSIDRFTCLIDDLGVGPGELQGDNRITGIENFQFPPFWGGYHFGNPVALYEIVWTPTEYGHWAAGFWTENHLAAAVYTDTYGDHVEYAVAIEPGSVQVVPAPGAALLLAGAGLGVFRRREARAAR